MKFKFNTHVLSSLGLVIVVAGLLLWFFWGGTAAPQYRSAKIEQGDLVAVVSASGTLNPVVSVSVGSQVSGQLKEVLVDFNSVVKAGQLIARIDPETFEYKLRQSEANVNAARTGVLREEINLTQALRDAAQRQSLFEKNFISAADRDKAKSTAEAQQAMVDSARAQQAVMQAQLAQARVDLARTAIRAPVDGVVTRKNIEPGQTVAASLQAPELFVIAKDLRDMQVEASIDEADVGRIREGQAATFTVDAFPGRTYRAQVRQVRKAALNVQNVITYVVVIAARNEDLQLLPGMTANVRITTDQRENVLKVPNAALRYRPAEKSAEFQTKVADGTQTSAGGGNGVLRAMYERMQQELKLDSAQKQKLEQLFAGQREKYAAVREAPEEARKGMIERNRTELRGQINEVLNSEQRKQFETIAADLRGRGGAGGAVGLVRGRVTVLENGKPKVLNVQLGISDGSMTEIQGEGITVGMEVITGVVTPNGKAKPASTAPRLGL